MLQYNFYSFTAIVSDTYSVLTFVELAYFTLETHDANL